MQKKIGGIYSVVSKLKRVVDVYEHVIKLCFASLSFMLLCSTKEGGGNQVCMPIDSVV